MNESKRRHFSRDYTLSCLLDGGKFGTCFSDRIQKGSRLRFGKPGQEVDVAPRTKEPNKWQGHEIPWLYHGILSVYLAVLQCARELVLCGELVERRRHDCHTATGNSVSFCVCLGASKGEGEAKDDIKPRVTLWMDAAECPAEGCSHLLVVRIPVSYQSTLSSFRRSKRSANRLPSGQSHDVGKPALSVMA